MSSSYIERLKGMSQLDRAWQNVVHWRRQWQTTSVFLPWELHEHYEKAKRNDTERWSPQYSRCPNTTGEEQRNEDAEPKWKRHSIVVISGNESKVLCCKEHYCIGTWKVRSRNQGKLDVVTQEMARMNTDILEISELEWTGMHEFNSDDDFMYYCGQNFLRRNGVALIINKSPKCSTWVQSQKQQNDLGSFPRQTFQHHGNPSLCLNL